MVIFFQDVPSRHNSFRLVCNIYATELFIARGSIEAISNVDSLFCSQDVNSITDEMIEVFRVKAFSELKLSRVTVIDE